MRTGEGGVEVEGELHFWIASWGVVEGWEKVGQEGMKRRLKGRVGVGRYKMP
jgi:hypothetical protein